MRKKKRKKKKKKNMANKLVGKKKFLKIK